MCCRVSVGHVACPDGAFTSLIHVGECQCKRDSYGKAARCRGFDPFLGDIVNYRVFQDCGYGTIRKTKCSPGIQFTECRSIAFFVVLAVCKECPDKNHHLGIISILAWVQSLVGMSLIRATVPVLHLVQVGRSALI